jgi:hypothetical protein
MVRGADRATVDPACNARRGPFAYRHSLTTVSECKTWHLLAPSPRTKAGGGRVRVTGITTVQGEERSGTAHHVDARSA